MSGYEILQYNPFSFQRRESFMYYEMKQFIARVGVTLHSPVISY